MPAERLEMRRVREILRYRAEQGDDLANVTDIARALLTPYGMTDKLGHVALEKDRRSFLATDQPITVPTSMDIPTKPRRR